MAWHFADIWSTGTCYGWRDIGSGLNDGRRAVRLLTLSLALGCCCNYLSGWGYTEIGTGSVGCRRTNPVSRWRN